MDRIGLHFCKCRGGLGGGLTLRTNSSRQRVSLLVIIVSNFVIGSLGVCYFLGEVTTQVVVIVTVLVFEQWQILMQFKKQQMIICEDGAIFSFIHILLIFSFFTKIEALPRGSRRSDGGKKHTQHAIATLLPVHQSTIIRNSVLAQNSLSTI